MNVEITAVQDNYGLHERNWVIGHYYQVILPLDIDDETFNRLYSDLSEVLASGRSTIESAVAISLHKAGVSPIITDGLETSQESPS